MHTIKLTPPKDEAGFEDYTAKGRNDWFRAREMTVLGKLPARSDMRRVQISVRSGRIPDNDPLVLELSKDEAFDMMAAIANELSRPLQ